MRFERSYNAGAADLYTTTLGYGWSHNYEVNLVFSDTVGGEPNTVIAQGCHGSRFRFQDDWDDDGGYDPFPGVWATLTRTLETSPTYFLRGVDQSTYVFTSTGQLTEIRDPQGHAVTLVYSDTQLLARVQDATGERYLGFKYDDSDRLIEVRDPINRRVRYGYEGGDLVVVTDTLTNTWTYAGLFNSK